MQKREGWYLGRCEEQEWSKMSCAELLIIRKDSDGTSSTASDFNPITYNVKSQTAVGLISRKKQHCEKRSVALVDGRCSGPRIELLCLLINFLQPLTFLLFKIFPHSSLAIKPLQLQSDIFTQPTMGGLLPGQTKFD